ncbi:MAG TPA: hypothetical protein VKQ72_03730 [Aggregatilineales bacterium]|nr:hypothetical protein [Aggregatilineales bacterium]
MTLDEWLLLWKPSDFSFALLVFVIIAFLWTRVWPWFTREYFPARQRELAQRLEIEAHQEEARLAVMSDIRDSLVELRTLVRQQGEQIELLALASLGANPDGVPTPPRKGR